MNVFGDLKTRFILSTKSAIERTPVEFSHLGVSDGSPNALFRFPDRNVSISTETIFVGEEAWEVVNDLSERDVHEKVCELIVSGYSMGISTSYPAVLFGDGDHHGAIPPVDHQIRASYEKAVRTISDLELAVIFRNAVFPVKSDFNVEIGINSFDPSSGVLDLEFENDSIIDYILMRSRLDYEIARVNSGDSIYFKSQSLVVDGKAVTRSQVSIIDALNKLYMNRVNKIRLSGQKHYFVLKSDLFSAEE